MRLAKQIFTLHLILFCLMLFIFAMTCFFIEKEHQPVMALLISFIYLADCFVFHIADVLSLKN